jgi:hypothetical protein
MHGYALLKRRGKNHFRGAAAANMHAVAGYFNPHVRAKAYILLRYAVLPLTIEGRVVIRALQCVRLFLDQLLGRKL